MYTQPETSRMAKSLTRELGKLGLKLKHTQAMEVVARMSGERNLAVHQARARKAQPDAEVLAREQAAAHLFLTTGRYGAEVEALLDDIDAAFRMEFSRDVERALHSIFETEGAPVLQPHIKQMYRYDEMRTLYVRAKTEALRLIDRTLSLSRELCATRSDVLYHGEMLDWSLEEGTPAEELPAQSLRKFDVKVVRSGSSLAIDITLPHADVEALDGTDQLSILLEVNKGLPCAHLTSEVYGDSHVSVFGTGKGTLVRFNETPEAPEAQVDPDVGAHSKVPSAPAN